MNLSPLMRRRVTGFLEDCIKYDKAHYMLDGGLTTDAINQSIKVLIENGIYTPIELSKNVLEICDTLIPVNYIEEIVA